MSGTAITANLPLDVGSDPEMFDPDAPSSGFEDFGVSPLAPGFEEGGGGAHDLIVVESLQNQLAALHSGTQHMQLAYQSAVDTASHKAAEAASLQDVCNELRAALQSKSRDLEELRLRHHELEFGIGARSSSGRISAYLQAQVPEMGKPTAVAPAGLQDMTEGCSSAAEPASAPFVLRDQDVRHMPRVVQQGGGGQASPTNSPRSNLSSAFSGYSLSADRSSGPRTSSVPRSRETGGPARRQLSLVEGEIGCALGVPSRPDKYGTACGVEDLDTNRVAKQTSDHEHKPVEQLQQQQPVKDLQQQHLDEAEQKTTTVPVSQIPPDMDHARGSVEFVGPISSRRLVLSSIGITIDVSKRGVGVLEVAVGGSAEINGELRKRDTLVEIGGRHITGASAEQIEAFVEGSVGTPVKIKALRFLTGEAYIVDLVRMGGVEDVKALRDHANFLETALAEQTAEIQATRGELGVLRLQSDLKGKLRARQDTLMQSALMQMQKDISLALREVHASEQGVMAGHVELNRVMRELSGAIKKAERQEEDLAEVRRRVECVEGHREQAQMDKLVMSHRISGLAHSMQNHVSDLALACTQALSESGKEAMQMKGTCDRLCSQVDEAVSLRIMADKCQEELRDELLEATLHLSSTLEEQAKDKRRSDELEQMLVIEQERSKGAVDAQLELLTKDLQVVRGELVDARRDVGDASVRAQMYQSQLEGERRGTELLLEEVRRLARVVMLEMGEGEQALRLLSAQNMQFESDTERLRLKLSHTEELLIRAEKKTGELDALALRLSAEYSNSVKDKEQFSQELTKTQHQVVSLREDLASAEAKIVKMVGEVEVVKRDKEVVGMELQKEVYERSIEKAFAEEVLEGLRSRSDSLEAQTEQLRKELERAVASLDKANAEADIRVCAISKDLQASTQQAEDLKAQLEAESKEWESHFARFEEEGKNAMKRTLELEEQAADVLAKLNAATADNQHMSQSLATLNNDAEIARTRTLQLEIQISQMRQDAADSLRESNQLAATLESAINQKSNVESQLQLARRDLELLSNQVVWLTMTILTDLELFEHEMDAHVVHTAQSEGEIIQLGATLAASRQEAEEQKEKNHRLEEMSALLSAELSKAVGCRDSATDEAQKLREQLQQERRDKGRMSAEVARLMRFESCVAGLRLQLASAWDELGEARNKQENAESIAAHAKTELQCAVDKCEHLTDCVSSATSVCQRVKADLEEQRNERRRLSAEVTRMAMMILEDVAEFTDGIEMQMVQSAVSEGRHLSHCLDCANLEHLKCRAELEEARTTISTLRTEADESMRREMSEARRTHLWELQRADETSPWKTASTSSMPSLYQDPH